MNQRPYRLQVGTVRWIWLVLGVCALLTLVFGVIRQVELQRLEATARILREYGRATHDLSTGFLHLTLGSREDGPWERARGFTLLRQALREMESATRDLPEGDQLTIRFRGDLANFEALLGKEALSAKTLTNEVALHLALGQLQATAEETDARLRIEQQRLSDRFARRFNAGVALGILLLLLLSAFAVRASWAERRLDRRLAESEERFRTLVEQAHAGVWIAREGIVRYVNARCAAIFGRTEAEMIGRPILELVPARFRDEYGQILGRLAQDPGVSFNGTIVVETPAGAEKHLEMQSKRIHVDGADAVLAFFQDVSERIKAESERNAALQMLESLTQSSQDSIFAKDREGRYTLYNPRVQQMTGKSDSEVLGRFDTDIYEPEHARIVMAQDQEIMRQGKSRRFETVLPTTSGLRTLDTVKGPLFNKDGKVVGILGIMRDITERKAQEKSLEEGRAELEAIVDALDEGLLVYSMEGRILRLNSAASRIIGMPFDPEQGVSVADRRALVGFETLQGEPIPFEDWPAQRLLRGETLQNVECVVVDRLHDRRRTVNCNGSLVKGAGGTARLGLLTFTDVTEQRRAQAALIQAQRLESLGTLAAGIAHDFNNILLAISGNASLADKDLAPDHPAHASLLEVQRAGQRAKDLVRRILLFARAEDSQRRTADLGDVITEAVELMRPTLPARIQLLKSLPTAPLVIDMDVSQIHQVLVNLITNAAHAIDDAGTDRRGEVSVTLAETRLEAAGQFGTRTLSAGRYARVTVADNGCGMDAQVLERVFDPFFTTKVVGRGTGLGLSIVRSIIEDHGGSILITSEPGRGTRVEILLPHSVRNAQPDAPLQVATHGSGRRILYIDDEPALVSLVTRFLRRQGYEVTGSTDPQEALQVFSAHPEQYDLVVTDLSMPQMSGFDVAQAVRDRSPAVPVIMMSGYVRPEDRDRAAALGIREVLLKPSTVEDLCLSIGRQLH